MLTDTLIPGADRFSAIIRRCLGVGVRDPEWV